jgi:hypothetical protein
VYFSLFFKVVNHYKIVVGMGKLLEGSSRPTPRSHGVITFERVKQK